VVAVLVGLMRDCSRRLAKFLAFFSHLIMAWTVCIFIAVYRGSRASGDPVFV
jgi:hypothetical protein